jgi:peptidylamidoglycolate lyase
MIRPRRATFPGGPDSCAIGAAQPQEGLEQTPRPLVPSAPRLRAIGATRAMPAGPPPLVVASLLAAAATTWFAPEASAGHPSYPPEPTVIEYVVDPDWPERPDHLGPRGAVPGVEVDREDRIWCLERTEVPVQVYSAEGKLLRSWGKGQFRSPHTIRFDGQGNVWITDHVEHTVKKFTPEGELLLTLGTPGEAGDDERRFNGPTDVAVTPAGDVFITDGYGNRRVVHFDREGKFVKAWGRYGGGPGEFALPHMIVVDRRGTLFVADRNSGRVQLFDQTGKFLDQWANLVMPWGLWISPNDELWVCGSSPQWWRKDGRYPPPKDQIFMRFSTDGRAQQLWTVPLGRDGEEKPGECNWLHCVALDSKGNIYAGDIMGKRVQKFVRTMTEAGR